MSTIKIAAVLIVVGVFAFVVLLMFLSERKRLSKKTARAADLGFQVLNEVPSALMDRIQWLHERRGHHELYVKSLAALDRSGYSLFLFDLFDTGGDDVSLLQADTLMVVSPELVLPRFTLLPKIVQDGLLAEWVNKAIQQLLKRHGDRVVHTSNQHFNERFLLLGEDETRAASFFDRIALSILSQFEYVMVEGGGDAFTYARLPVPPQDRPTSSVLPEQLHEAHRLFQILREASASE